MTEQDPQQSTPKIVSGQSARKACVVFNYGNMIAIAVPIPLGLLWVGASMVVYAMNRHHPNPRVGHYTQQAAYRFYGVTGFFVAVATFFPGGNWTYYLAAWAAAALVLLPWSVWELVKIYKDDWRDMQL